MMTVVFDTILYFNKLLLSFIIGYSDLYRASHSKTFLMTSYPSTMRPWFSEVYTSNAVVRIWKYVRISGGNCIVMADSATASGNIIIVAHIATESSVSIVTPKK